MCVQQWGILSLKSVIGLRVLVIGQVRVADLQVNGINRRITWRRIIVRLGALLAK